jgi:hypothetical protein
MPAPCNADDVARGLARLFLRQGEMVLAEWPLPNGRRADLVVVDPRGQISIVEIKVSRADLLGDCKWRDYLDWCDRFYWAICPAIDPGLLDLEHFLPDRCGLLVADRYDAALLRDAETVPMAPARRRSETLRLARAAMRRSMLALDRDLTLLAAAQDMPA